MNSNTSEYQLNRDSPALFRQIADILCQKILSGEYKRGDALPSEREIAELFNASRVPVREAIKALEYIGVIRQIRGRGVFVQDVDLGKVLKVVGPFGIEPTREILLQLFDFRALVEVNAVREAAKNANDEDIQVLRELVKHTKKNLDKDIEKDSYDFHLKIVEIARNEIAISVTRFYSEILKCSRKATLKTKERRREAYEFHEKILKAIMEHNEQDATFYMKEHLRTAKKWLEHDNHEESN